MLEFVTYMWTGTNEYCKMAHDVDEHSISSVTVNRATVDSKINVTITKTLPDFESV